MSPGLICSGPSALRVFAVAQNVLLELLLPLLLLLRQLLVLHHAIPCVEEKKEAGDRELIRNGIADF